MAYTELEDDKGRLVQPLVANESEDGTGTWDAIVCDSNGYVKAVVAATHLEDKMAYLLLEDEFGRIVRVPVFNESEDGSGDWHVPVCDSSGFLKVNLDISTLLENPPTEDEADKAPTSEWAFDHDAAGTGIHEMCKAKKTTDNPTVNNSETLVTVDEMLVPVEANKNYTFLLLLYLTQANNTPDFKFGWAYPSGTTMEWNCNSFNTPAGSTQSSEVAYTTGITGNISLFIYGHIQVSSTAGNIQLKFAQNTATSVNNNVKTGSMLLLLEV